MKMNADLDTLKAACGLEPPANDSQKLSEGESFWIMGMSVAAEEGCIGLSMGVGHSVLLKEASILEVRKNGAHYFVRVKAGTTALVRHETVTTLQNPQCSCSNEGPSRLAHQNNDDMTEGYGGSLIPVRLVCVVRTQCINYMGHSICVPYLQCSDGGPPYHPEDDVTE